MLNESSAAHREGGSEYSQTLWVDEEVFFAGTLPLLRDVRDQAIVLHGLQYSKDVAERLCQAYGIPIETCSLTVASATDSEVERCLQVELMTKCSTIIAVGGGRVQDVSKLIAKRLDKTLIVVPTLIATDGVASPVSVIRDSQGRSTSHGAKAPDWVLLCWSLLARAPVRYWQALVGDVVGNLVAVRDFRRFGIETQKAESLPVIEQSCQMAEASALEIIAFNAPSFANDIFRKTLVEAAIQSSRAMVYAGNSLPCSGSEHLLSHAIDSLRLGLGTLHGIQVGAAVPFCLSLHEEEALRDEVEETYTALDIPKSILRLGEPISRYLDDIIKIAPDTRPGRKTILDQYTNDQLISRLNRWQ